MNLKTETNITISLSLAECLWLKSVMQNPLFLDKEGDEDLVDKEYRTCFFKLLNGFLDRDNISDKDTIGEEVFNLKTNDL